MKIYGSVFLAGIEADGGKNVALALFQGMRLMDDSEMKEWRRACLVLVGYGYCWLAKWEASALLSNGRVKSFDYQNSSSLRHS